jgi:Outer membrane efflux protein
LKDKAFLSFLGQNPPFELRPKIGVSPPIFSWNPSWLIQVLAQPFDFRRRWTAGLIGVCPRAALLEQARNNADSAAALLTRRRNDAVRQLVVADNALRTSLSAYSASSALVAAAQTTFDSALASYRNRVGSITDVNIAQTQLLQARNASTDTYSTALSAAATLASATGALGSAPR